MDEQEEGEECMMGKECHFETEVITKSDQQEKCQVSDESSAIHTSLDSQKLPVTMLVTGNTLSDHKPSKSGDQGSQSEQFIIFDQNGQPLQCERMVILTGQPESGLYVIPSNQLERTQVLLPQGHLMDVSETTSAARRCEDTPREDLQTVAVTAIADSGLAMTTPAPVTATKTGQTLPDCFRAPLPPGAPSWAQRLRSCEKIGESYRGFCTTEAELEAVLLLHKQQTHSVFGTRQSPSPAKPATRLMWKSQYVPYDGIPFVNAGSRAIVMECQFGPRRKGLQPKKVTEQENGQNPEYKATCPARIYIKKVRKFPEYRVSTDPKVDKKVVRQEQEKAFFNLKKSLWDAGGVLRYYIQLPTEKAHLYHDVETPPLPPPPPPMPLLQKGELLEEEQEMEDGRITMEGGDGDQEEDGGFVPSRLHPRVAEKICELVAQGYHQVYTVRKQLRRFVEREMFKSDEVPERHNLCYFPTVNDIKNHIHEAQKALQQNRAGFNNSVSDTQWTTEGDNPLAETVTLTLTPAPLEVTQKVGVLQGSETLSQEAVQLFSSLTSLQPKIFAHLRSIQVQSVLCPGESLPPQTTVGLQCSEPEALAPSSPTQYLQSSASLVEGVSLTDSSALLGMGQLVSVSVLGEGAGEASVQQILLGDAQTIPVQIIEPAGVEDQENEHTQVKEESEDNMVYTTHSPGD